jgi:diguanylate cyclase (GGDEF)-like protein/PAS domain S-box-containing protein
VVIDAKMFLAVRGGLANHSEATLREQYASLKQQVPLMYALMFINVMFLSIATSEGQPTATGLIVPTVLSVLIAIRAGAWIVRRKKEASVKDIRRRLIGTVIVAAVLSAFFGAWGVSLFDHDRARSTAIALYVFVGSISCCYCLQALPTAARFVLLFGALPITVRLLTSQDWYLAGVGVTFLLVAAVILRTLVTSRSAFLEVLRSRSEMGALVKALQQSEENYRYSVELNPQIPWISDPDGNVVELSPRWSALTGVPIEQGLGSGWMAAVHPDDLETILKAWNATLARAEGAVADSRYRLRQADGRYCWFRARAYPRLDAEGQVVSWYGNLEDIDDQVAGELALRESEERYRLAARATNDIIWDWSHSTNQIHWADGIQSAFGYPGEILGTSMDWWMERIHPDDITNVRETYDRVIDNRQDSWSHEYRFKAADGDYIYVFSRGYVVRDTEGNAVRSIGALLDVTVARRVEEDLRWAAYHDPLTGLPNRKMFTEQLEKALADANAASSCVGVIVIDVDGFKSINDSMGHATGDAVLKMVAARIQEKLPHGATVSRLGGDEFSIILPNLVPQDARAETVARILHGVGDGLAVEENVLSTTLSAGAAMWPIDGASGEEVLKSADLALYAAKAEGNGSIKGFQPAMRDMIESRQRMLQAAKNALADDRVIPFYQPKICLKSGEIIGFEALLRWHHHRRGLQPPSTLQAAFEDSALSTQLTDRMLDRVLADMVAWTEEGRAFGRIAVNGSPADFGRGDFAERILTRLQRYGLDPAQLELEITESVFLGQLAYNVESALRSLTSEGVTIALDDFGTGYASLTHLRQFPVNTLKIDRSFISRLGSADCADFAIVHGVIDIAHRMNIETVAEGVEKKAHVRQLRDLGCDIGQGFFFSRAVSASRVPVFMDYWRENNGTRDTRTSMLA